MSFDGQGISNMLWWVPLGPCLELNAPLFNSHAAGCLAPPGTLPCAVMLPSNKQALPRLPFLPQGVWAAAQAPRRRLCGPHRRAGLPHICSGAYCPHLCGTGPQHLGGGVRQPGACPARRQRPPDAPADTGEPAPLQAVQHAGGRWRWVPGCWMLAGRRKAVQPSSDGAGCMHAYAHNPHHLAPCRLPASSAHPLHAGTGTAVCRQWPTWHQPFLAWGSRLWGLWPRRCCCGPLTHTPPASRRPTRRRRDAPLLLWLLLPPPYC